MTDPRRIGLLGGMFDPIHCGHLDSGDAAERALGLTDVLVIPASRPPHRAQPHASSHHRFAMAAMAVAGRPSWRAVDIELRETGTSYTSATLRRFHAEGLAPTGLYFIAGADAFLEIATWHDYPIVLDLAHFAIVARPGLTVGELPVRLPALRDRMRPAIESSDAAPQRTWIFLIDANTANVSSTAIRQARLNHHAITGLVPPSVEQHIEQHGLYQNSFDSAGDSRAAAGRQAGRLHGQD
jgi:nicotinate-nucleotide adenylyltransferase